MKNLKDLKFLPFYLLSVLPWALLYGISNFLCFVLYRIMRYRRAVVRANIAGSFPEKSGVEQKKIEKEFYQHFCDIMMESVKALTLSQAEIKRRFQVTNPELIQKFHDENRSIVMYAAHQGNWEWIGFLPLYLPHQVTSFYQPLSNKYFDALMLRIRTRNGVICVEQSKGYRAILGFAQKKILTLNCIIGDQSPGRDSSMHWTQFLHRETGFLMGAARIAQKSHQAVVFPAFQKVGRGRYTLEFKVIEANEVAQDDWQVIDRYAQILEESIRQAPALWLWSHRRWKLKRV